MNKSRSKKLTQSADGKECIRCGKGGGTVRACHYTGIRQYQYGKGKGIKCHDLATAEFCDECDTLFAEGRMVGFESKEDKSEQWLHYIMLTNIRRMNSGILKV